MAKTNHDGYLVSGSSATLNTGSGRLLGYLISHAETTPQTVVFYDNTAASGTIAHRVTVAPERCPIYIRLGQPPGRDEGIIFTTGLTVDPGNCDVAVWSIGYGV